MFFYHQQSDPMDKLSKIQVSASHAWCLSQIQSIYMISFLLKLILKCDQTNQDSMFPNRMNLHNFPLDIK